MTQSYTKSLAFINKRTGKKQFKVKKYLFLIAGILMIGYLIGTFFGFKSSLFADMNTWIQRLLLAIVATGFLSLYFKKKAE